MTFPEDLDALIERNCEPARVIAWASSFQEQPSLQVAKCEDHFYPAAGLDTFFPRLFPC
jgi:hypothetical protein